MNSENPSVYQVAAQQNDKKPSSHSRTPATDPGEGQAVHSARSSVVPSQWPYTIAQGPADARTMVLVEAKQARSENGPPSVSKLLPGQRLRLVGSLAFIGQMSAQALSEGVLTQEIEVSIEDGPVAVWCACCGQISPQSSPTDTHVCSNCRTVLSVRRAQFSPRLGAFLGVAQLASTEHEPT